MLHRVSQSPRSPGLTPAKAGCYLDTGLTSGREASTVGVRNTVRARATRVLLSTACTWVLGGCGDLEIKPDSASGKDADRSGADQLFLDKLMDDYLSADEGDNTDWKYFKVTDRGILTLTVFWDDHKKVDSIVDVRDRFGALIGSITHSSELEKDKLDLKVEPGTHFVRLYADKGSSVYTIEGLFQAFDHQPDASEDLRPVDINQVELDPGGFGVPPADDARPIAVDGGRRPGRKPPQRTPPDRSNGGQGGDARPGKEPPPQVAGNLVSATINRIIDGRGKKGAYIWISKGSEDGILVGAEGYVVDDDGSSYARIKVEKVNDRGAQAFCSASPTEIAHRRRVKVQGK